MNKYGVSFRNFFFTQISMIVYICEYRTNKNQKNVVCACFENFFIKIYGHPSVNYLKIKQLTLEKLQIFTNRQLFAFLMTFLYNISI